MLRTSGIAMSVAGAVLAGAILGAQVFAQRADEPAAAEPRPQPWPTKRMHLIDDVRRNHVSPLQGTILDEPPADAQADFQKAIEKVAAEEPSAAASPLAPLPPRQEAAFSELVSGDDPIASLRHASRALDALAADAEDQSDYARADLLRKLARQVRSQARLLQPR